MWGREVCRVYKSTEWRLICVGEGGLQALEKF